MVNFGQYMVMAETAISSMKEQKSAVWIEMQNI